AQSPRAAGANRRQGKGPDCRPPPSAPPALWDWAPAGFRWRTVYRPWPRRARWTARRHRARYPEYRAWGLSSSKILESGRKWRSVGPEKGPLLIEAGLPKEKCRPAMKLT